jgi:pimeloyl-ACP methyl ester carboxylesterase
MVAVSTCVLIPALAGVRAAFLNGPTQRIDWSPCGAGGATECGAVRVPLDWAHPDGPEIGLEVARLPARDPAHRIGALLDNPGGPGGSSLGTVLSQPGRYYPAELLRDFDIIGFGPRGVIPSVNCGVKVYDPAVPQFPRDEREYDRLVAHNRAAGESCLAGTGRVLAHLDTVSAARDIDWIRAALGEQRISWLGRSYGTMLGAQYAQLFPNRVDRMVLDGAVDHGLHMDQVLRTEAAAVEDEFNRFTDWCAGSTTCALHGRDAAGIWDALMSQAAQHPVGRPGQQVTAEQIRYDVQFQLDVFPEQAASLSREIAAASRGDASLFRKDIQRISGLPVLEPYRAITCLDFSTELPGGFPQLVDRMRDVRAVAPHMGGASEFWGVMTGCIGWPVPPVDPQQPVHVVDAPPVLIVSNSHDDATPVEWGQSLNGAIAGSRLLVRDGDGHTAFRRSPCATREIVAYLTSGALPPPDRICRD